MWTFIMTAIIGIVCIVLGISNTKGNISSLHSYHRDRVAEEDVLPFGKIVGTGTIVVGAAVLIMSAFSLCGFLLEKTIFTIIGTVILIVGIVVGLGISFYGMIKYNKGIF